LVVHVQVEENADDAEVEEVEAAEEEVEERSSSLLFKHVTPVEVKAVAVSCMVQHGMRCAAWDAERCVLLAGSAAIHG
jgi:hypothetical protein